MMNSRKYKRDIIADKYFIIDRIGNGSFGEVYIAKDNDGREFAIKTESNHGNSKLPYEYRTYTYLRKNGFREGIPRIYNFIECPSYNMMVMQLLGKSLEDLFNAAGRTFKLGTILAIGTRIAILLENIHTAKLLHRDIKPNNFMVGKDNPDSLYIMDFGLSKLYERNGKHIQFKKGKSLVGTTRYASINVHDGLEPSRRDELESVGYMLIYFYKGRLPWQGLIKKAGIDSIKMIGNVKKSIPLDELCRDLPMCFYLYLDYCRQLGFSEQPDYDYIRWLFVQEGLEQKIELQFEWT